MSAPGLDRRSLIAAGIAGAALGTVSAQAATAAAREETYYPPQRAWSSPPPQVPVTERMIAVDDGELWSWDTGGSGPPVILMHPVTGSAAIWGYQQPALARSGFRVIAFSRRGHFRSSPASAEKPVPASRDLHAVIEALKIDRVHLLGCAAGAFALPDYAISHPDRVRSLIIASSLAGIVDSVFAAASKALRPANFLSFPAEFRELGPSYRAANPTGVAAWQALEAAARTGPLIEPASVNRVDWPAIGRISAPVLLMTGDADLYLPPPMLRAAAVHFRSPAIAIVGEAGHALSWEQPDAFNRAVLRFLKRSTISRGRTG